MCRTYHFATHGTSDNQYSAFLKTIQLNTEPTPWRAPEMRAALRRVHAHAEYDERLLAALRAARAVPPAEARALAARGAGADAAVRVEYRGLDRGADCFERTARALGIMENIKAGVPRTAYRGVVEFWAGQTKVYVTPPLDEVERELRSGRA